ncbi:hypothetical protein BsIDN1_08370 [Bacillus safensis]|uniref:Uncharacterized protein n=1 Tax=Bacillus safensis TaxID=561879 RepID=A0A5S9M5N2_BACIA|nr:hypothetical protein BsIDN1_08370 [Bacillus safensis]
MKHVSIAAIPGDGVGKEVVPEAIRVLKAISDVHGAVFHLSGFSVEL